MAEVAAIASEVTGREVRHTTVTDDAWRDGKIAAGMPPVYADMLLGMFLAARRGDFAATDPALSRLLARPPRTMRDVLAVWMPCTLGDGPFGNGRRAIAAAGSPWLRSPLDEIERDAKTYPRQETFRDVERLSH